MQFLPPAFLATALLALTGCSPALDDPSQADAARGARRADATAQAPRREPLAPARPGAVEPPVATSRPAAVPNPTAAMGAAPAPSAAPGLAAASSAVPKVDDAQITARVRAEIAAARDLADVRIDVDTREGVVTLSGAVRSAAIKARAGEIARTVRGVQEVNDQLTLATS